jgi:hypothetical protein
LHFRVSKGSWYEFDADHLVLSLLAALCFTGGRANIFNVNPPGHSSVVEAKVDWSVSAIDDGDFDM